MFNYEGPFEDKNTYNIRSKGNKQSYIDKPYRKTKYKKSMDKVRKETDYIDKLRQANIKRYEDQNERLRTSIDVKRVRSTRKSRNKTREISKERYLKGLQDNFIINGRRVSRGNVHFYNNYWLRSDLEYKIAKLLTRMNYKWSYEEFKVCYVQEKDERIHLIDFYIKDINMIIECKYEKEIDGRVEFKKDSAIKEGYKYIIATEKDDFNSLKDKIKTALLSNKQ